MRQEIAQAGRKNDLKAAIPGLAPRPPPPVPVSIASAAVPARRSEIPTCPSCTPLREALRQANEQLLSAQMRIKGAILAGKEAIHRSSIRVDAYEILDKVCREHGIPFEDGRPFPEEYKDSIPVHEFDDGIVREIGNREPSIANVGTAATTQSQPPMASQIGGEQHAGDKTPSNESESDESIPRDFHVSDYEVSENGSSPNALDEESENERNWELDAEEVGDSDVEEGDVEDNDDSTGGDGSEGDSG